MVRAPRHFVQADLASHFRLRYAHGEGQGALRVFFPSLDSSLDDAGVDDSEVRHLANYADALAFGWPVEARQANQIVQADLHLGPFQEALVVDEALLWIRSLPQSPEWLRRDLAMGEWERAYARWLCGTGSMGGLLKKCPKSCRPRFFEHLQLHARWLSLQRRQRHILSHLSSPPFLPLTFFWSSPITIPSDGLVALFVEAVAIDWRGLFEALEGRQVLFLFPDAATLQHCLSLSDLFDLLMAERGDWIHVLDHYPTETLGKQPPLPVAPLHLVSLASRPFLDPYMSSIDLALQSLQGAPIVESEACNHLYEAGRRVSWALRARRLGLSRQTSYRFNCHQEAWHGRHKGRPPKGARVGPTVEEAFPIPRPTRCRRQKSGALQRIAHVVPQLVDCGHAPTRLYRTLFRYHNRQRYETHLLISEEHVFRTSEYPFPRFYSDFSEKRGETTLQQFREREIPVWLGPIQKGYVEVAEALAEELTRREIDIAIFHGAGPVNRLASCRCSIPGIALFDHGALLPQGGFDLYIAATAEERARGFDGRVIELPHVVDVREDWEQSDPFAVEHFQLPKGAQLLTTISFHLSDRLSDPMCDAVADILVRCPRAHYVPIGPIGDRDQCRIRRSFETKGVSDRLRFLGMQRVPSQLARSMTLYLNEFPFGGGVALLDALGAGLPVISMYDPDGPHQARYAANAIGLDRVITSGLPADYTALACRLLEDEAERKLWSEAALVAYERRGSAADYVRRLEEALEEWWNS